ncbi:Ig-like domain-containing protein [Paenibacillus urinalis]|uniref:Ig-like domain-containing protein n=1 Tax=Paenibacillus urinalis TaxID=521520 RepID=UPI00236800E3|nr:Ig-like domain-containing protein [Paenibacillus urinalis]WDH98302.1 Ig-like domain-containing protein [Paenibacillus urinalis]
MSNTGNPFTSTSNHKENNHVMISRGGEKKVMKKILSVALSTAMAFSMFASVAFGQTGLTDVNAQYNYLKDKGIFAGFPDGQAHLDRQMTRAEFAKVITKTLGLKEVEGVYSFKDKNYGENHWAAPYVEAVYAAGIMEGVNSTKKIFGVSNPVTIQEMATVLVRALDLEVPTETNNSATTWAKGYVQAAINAGLVDANANFQSNATRELLVGAAYAVDQELSLSVESYTVIESGKAVEFKMTDGETVKVTLDTALEANKETEVKFTYQEKEFTEKVTYVVTTATKFESAAASNLAQVVLNFDGTVDKNTAEDADNYTIWERDNHSATKDVKSAVLSADGKSVTLTVATTGSDVGFSNQLAYQVSFNNIKAGDKVLSVTNHEFTPVDSTLPVVESAQALGNKTIRLVFSEPVKTANPGNFQVDGNTLVGSTKVTGNTVIIKLYSALSDGAHKVTATNVEDYAGFKSLNKELSFDVVADTTAPTVAVESATFETVTLKFSEPVDPDTVLASNVYWVQGSTKNYATGTPQQIADDTFKFTWSNKLQYATDVFVTNVKDYSGNTIAADTKVAVTPVLDQTRPEVVNAELKSDRKTITVKFSKALEKSSVAAGDFVIKDAEGDEVSKLKTVDTSADGKTVTVTLAAALSEGKTYTLNITGVNDDTTLKNVILPYSKELNAKDNTAPELAGTTVVRNVTNNTITVTYNEAMAVSGDGAITDRAKYSYNTAANGWQVVPSSVNINVTSDGKSAVLGFPSNIKVADITDLNVRLVKDVAGNYLKDLTSGNVSVVNAGAVAYTGAAATATNKIEVAFDKALLSSTVSASDFTVNSGLNELSVISASLSSDAKKVVLTLADSTKLNENGAFGSTNSPVTVTVKAGATTSTSAGEVIGAATHTVTDKIAATISSVKGLANGDVQVVFNETLDTTDTTNTAVDFVIKTSNGTLTPNAVGASGYTVQSISDNIVTIRFNESQQGIAEVSIPTPRYLKDNRGTLVASSEALQVEVKTQDLTAPNAADATKLTVEATQVTGLAGAVEANATVKIVADGDDATDTAVGSATAKADGSFSAITGLSAGTAYDLYVIDAAGNDSVKLDITTTVAP